MFTSSCQFKINLRQLKTDVYRVSLFSAGAVSLGVAQRVDKGHRFGFYEIRAAVSVQISTGEIPVVCLFKLCNVDSEFEQKQKTSNLEIPREKVR